MKNILITTDFSPHSKYTLKYLVNLLQDTQISCRLLLLNTYLVPEADASRILPLHDEIKKKSKAGLEEERREALKGLTSPHIKIEMASHFGSLQNVIGQIINREKIDLVAMGKDGGKHVETIASLCKERECPLLITYHNH